MLILLAVCVAARSGDLEIDDVDVYVNNKFIETVDSDGGHFQVMPGDDVSLSIFLENTFEEDEEDIDFEDVDVEVIIEKFKDGDDWEAASTRVEKLRADDKETVQLDFVVPSDAVAKAYTVEIEAKGENKDDNDDEYDDRVDLRMIVTRPAHLLTVTDIKAADNVVNAGGRTSISAKITNDGSTIESGSFSVYSSELKFMKKGSFSLSPGQSITQTGYFDIPEDAVSKTYVIDVEVRHTSGVVEEQVTLGIAGITSNVARTVTRTSTTTSSSSGANTIPVNYLNQSPDGIIIALIVLLVLLVAEMIWLVIVVNKNK